MDGSRRQPKAGRRPKGRSLAKIENAPGSAKLNVISRASQMTLDPASLPKEAPHWYALFTHSHCEEKVHDALSHKGFDVKKGFLEGIEGMLTEVDLQQSMFVVTIEPLQQGVAIRIDPGLVERCHSIRESVWP